MNTESAEFKACAKHLGDFVNGLATLLRDYVAPLNPADSEESMAYIRDVMDAVDNVVLVATIRQDDEDAKKILKASSDEMMRQLIELHNGSEEKH